MTDAADRSEGGRYVLLDLVVVVLAVALVGFLVVTMGIRTGAAKLEEECQDRLLALAQAQQLYLVKNGAFADSLPELRPFLEPGKERIPFTCPITGSDFMLRVQGDRYKIIAPGTDYSILTGDPSW
jgi:hypothetical protein